MIFVRFIGREGEGRDELGVFIVIVVFMSFCIRVFLVDFI